MVRYTAVGCLHECSQTMDTWPRLIGAILLYTPLPTTPSCPQRSSRNLLLVPPVLCTASKGQRGRGLQLQLPLTLPRPHYLPPMRYQKGGVYGSPVYACVCVCVCVCMCACVTNMSMFKFIALQLPPFLFITHFKSPSTTSPASF